MSNIQLRANSNVELRNLLTENISFPDSLLDSITGKPLFNPHNIPDGRIFNYETVERLINERKIPYCDIFHDCRQNVQKFYELTNFLEDLGVDYNELVYQITKNGLVDFEITSPQETIPSSNGMCHVLILDVSASMNTDCLSSEGYFTRLQLVLYASILIVKSLQSGDEISIVTFSDFARVLLPKTVITSRNVNEITRLLMSVTVQLTTNIGSGILLGYAQLLGRINENFSVHLLTDGINDHPLEHMQRCFIEGNRLVNGKENQFNIYGFSNEVNVDQLVGIAPGANFYFIPEFSMLLTNFVNGFANACFREPFELNDTDRFIISELEIFVERLCSLRMNDVQRKALLDQFVSNVDSIRSSLLNAIKLDFCYSDNSSEGQIEKAIRPDFYRVWGRRYLFSYLCCLKNKICTNYKDNLPRLFITPERDSVIDRCEITIASNPVTNSFTPKTVYFTSVSHSTQSQPVAAPTLYGSVDCIKGDSLFETTEGLVKIEDFTEETIVISEKGNTKISKLVKIMFSGLLFRHKSIALTAYHPVRINGEDRFPIDFLQSEYYNGYVYDVVLEDRSHLKSDDIIVAGWVHNEQTGIFKHDYFGSQKVLNDLKSNEFCVEFDPLCVRRDPETGLICGNMMI